MITALVLFVVVLTTHYFPNIPLVKNFLNNKGSFWVKIYLEFMLNALQKTSLLKGEVAAALAILPVVTITYLINNLFHLLLQEWGGMLFMVVTLYYCLSSNDIEDKHESILILVHERIFGILFWFVLFGATGAIFYWFLTVSKAVSDSIVTNMTNFARGIRVIHGLAAWLPARMTGFIYALVGDFIAGFNCWYSYLREVTVPSSKVLLDCGQASLASISRQDEAALAKRALVAWIIIDILIALIIAEVKS